MSPRWVIAGVLAAALFTGCTTAPRRWSPGRAQPQAQAEAPAPDRWERAACRMGEYPAELDARALARARFEDLRARRIGMGTIAAARLERERAAFDTRCAAWTAATVDGI